MSFLLGHPPNPGEESKGVRSFSQSAHPGVPRWGVKGPLPSCGSGATLWLQACFELKSAGFGELDGRKFGKAFPLA